MADENRVVPGIAATKKWLADNGVSINKFAISNGLDPADLRKLLKKTYATVSVKTALAIQRGTGGAVTADMFEPQKVNGG